MRTRKGTVTSISGNKTVVVMVHRYENHPIYKKRYRISKKFHAHNEIEGIAVGDEVTIAETKPISKLKKWRVLQESELAELNAA